MPNTATFRIKGVQFGPALALERTPLFLRFVMVGNDYKTLDALDLHEDAAKPEETIIAARRVGYSRVHVDRVVNGRRVGEWFKEAVYWFIDPQPNDFDMRDTPAWRAWCGDAYANEEKETAK